MEKLNQKMVESKVDIAIKSDNQNSTVVKEALALAIMYAASEVGRIQPLNRLVAGVTVATREGIRQFVINMTRKYGVKVKNEEGKERLVTFLNYSSKNKAYAHAQSLSVYKEARATIAKLSKDDLMELVLGSTERDNSNRVEQEFTLETFEQRISGILKKALASGTINSATAAQFNRLISAANRVDPAKVAQDVDKALEAARAKVKQAEERKARLANADKAEPIVPAAA